MKEDNKSKRKVLLSIRLWQLLFVVALVIVTVFSILLVKSVNTSKEISKVNIETVKTESSSTSKSYERKAVVSSRSSLGRERDTISVVEKPEEEQIEEEQEEYIVVSTPIDEIKISVDMDLTVRTGLSREDFIKLIAGVKADTSGFFEENAGLIYDVCEKYELNEIFFCGLISAESGWNIAQNHRNTYNYISLMSSNGLIRFSSVEDGLESAAKTLHDKYLTPGGAFYYGKTLSAMKTRFCPASPTWVNLVYGRMEQILY
jgi:hypothetical protein